MATENKRAYARRADSTIVDFVVEGHLYRGFTENWSRDGVNIAAVMDAAKLCENLGHTVEKAAPKLNYEPLRNTLGLIVAGHTAAMLDMIGRVMVRKAGSIGQNWRI